MAFVNEQITMKTPIHIEEMHSNTKQYMHIYLFIYVNSCIHSHIVESINKRPTLKP